MSAIQQVLMSYGGPVGDPYFADVSLLLHMDGTNGSTTFTDNSQNTFTVTPTSATVNTSVVKYGTGSVALHASRLDVASSSQFAFGTEDFTIEAWVYVNSWGSSYNQTIVTVGSYLTGVLIRLQSGTTMGIVVQSPSSVDFGCVITPGQWYHIAVSRSAGLLYPFKDGVLLRAPYGGAGSIGTLPVVVGVSEHNGSEYFDGYIDDFRITKGVARYTANFTPPTAAFPNS